MTLPLMYTDEEYDYWAECMNEQKLLIDDLRRHLIKLESDYEAGWTDQLSKIRKTAKEINRLLSEVESL